MDEERIEFVVKVNENLAGSYNQGGIITWWLRKRTLLDGHAPLEVLDDPEQWDTILELSKIP